jgi:DNA-binding MarR family transcriptional regulator
VDRDTAAQIADLIARTNRRLRRCAGDELRELGVTPGQFRVLRLLGRVGEVRISELARRLDIVPRSATSVLDDLEGLALIRRRPDPSDRRATLVSLTDAGQQVVGAVRESRQARMAELVDRLTSEDRDELIRLLQTLAD